MLLPANMPGFTVDDLQMQPVIASWEGGGT